MRCATREFPLIQCRRTRTKACCLCVKTEVLKQHPDVPQLRFPAVRQGVASKTIGSKVTPKEEYPRDKKDQEELPEGLK